MELRPARPKPSTMYVIQAPELDTLEPARDAVLATDHKLAADAGKLVRGRADLRADIAKLVARPSDDHDKRRAAVDKLTAQRDKLSDDLADLLAAHDAALTADGAWLHTTVAAERAYDHYESALSVYLDNPEAVAVPDPDFREAIAAIDTYAARFPDAYHAEARVLAARLTLESARDDAARGKLGRELVALAAGSERVAELAYQLADTALDASTAADDVRAELAALRWLADHAANPDRRIASGFKLAAHLDKQRDPGARDAYCKLAGATGKLASTFADSVTARLADSLVGDPGALVDACKRAACPCSPPVGEALANLYAGVGDDLDAADAIAPFPDQPFAARAQIAAPAPDDARRIARHLVMTGPVRRCLVREAAAHGELVASIAIDSRSVAREVHAVRSDLGQRVAACMLVALREQRWPGIADRILTVPLKVSQP